MSPFSAVRVPLFGITRERWRISASWTSPPPGDFAYSAFSCFRSRLVANNATSTVGVAGTGNGGGVSTRPGGRSLVIRATIVDNSATNAGGGVFNAGGTALVRTLVVRDRATTGGGVFGAVTAGGSIVRGNTPDNCVPADPHCN